MPTPKATMQSRSFLAVQSVHAVPLWKGGPLPAFVKQYCTLEVAWHTSFESQQPEQVLEQVLDGASHRPEKQVAPVVVQSAHTPPVSPHAVFELPATQLLPWQQPLVQFCGLQVLVLPSGEPAPVSKAGASSLADESSSAGWVSAVASTPLASCPASGPLASRPMLASPLASTAASMDPSSPPPPPPSSTYDASPPDAHAASTLVTSTAEQKHRQKLRFNTALSYAVIAAGLPARSAIRCE
jgi:hypothetical protein